MAFDTHLSMLVEFLSIVPLILSVARETYILSVKLFTFDLKCISDSLGKFWVTSAVAHVKIYFSLFGKSIA